MAGAKIIITPKADEDLKDIYMFLFSFSPKAADIQINILLEKIELLENFPKLGRVIQDFENEQLRELVIGNYLIAYYIVSSSRIDILTVHHSSQPRRI